MCFHREPQCFYPQGNFKVLSSSRPATSSIYKSGFHPAPEFWQSLSAESGCASVHSTTEGRWHSLPQPFIPLALRFAALWLGPWIVNSRLSLQRHSFERDKQEKRVSEQLGEQPEWGKYLMVITRLWLLGCDETCWISAWLSTISTWKGSALQWLSSSLTERKRKKLKHRVCNYILWAPCMFTWLLPFPLPPASLLTGVCWGRLWREDGPEVFTANTTPLSKAQCSEGPSTRQKDWGTLLPWRLLAAGRQLPHPCRTHKSCCSTCTPPAKVYNHPFTEQHPDEPTSPVQHISQKTPGKSCI